MKWPDLREFGNEASDTRFEKPRFLWRVILSSQDWSEQCEAANTALCDVACTCGANGEECCWGVPGSLSCNDSYNCSRNDALCADPTITPTELQLCIDELPSLTCGTGIDLSGACAPLYNPFLN